MNILQKIPLTLNKKKKAKLNLKLKKKVIDILIIYLYEQFSNKYLFSITGEIINDNLNQVLNKFN